MRTSAAATAIRHKPRRTSIDCAATRTFSVEYEQINGVGGRGSASRISHLLVTETRALACDRYAELLQSGAVGTPRLVLLRHNDFSVLYEKMSGEGKVQCSHRPCVCLGGTPDGGGVAAEWACQQTLQAVGQSIEDALVRRLHERAERA